MDSSERRGSMTGPVLFAAVVSLGLTLLRVWGEKNGWSPRFFNREPGGPFSIVAIIWLVPILGIWFSMRLGELGRGPASKGRALLFPIVGFALIGAAGSVVGDPDSPVTPIQKVALINAAGAVAGFLSFLGWKDLGRTLLVYGYLARLPVVVVTYFALQQNWGTHFEKGLPGLPEMPFLQKWLVIAVLPQFVTWIGFTMTVGSLFGGLLAVFHRAKAPAPATTS